MEGGAHNQQSDNQRVLRRLLLLLTCTARHWHKTQQKIRKCYEATRVLLCTRGNLGYSEVTTEINPLTDIPNSHTCDEYLLQHEYQYLNTFCSKYEKKKQAR